MKIIRLVLFFSFFTLIVFENVCLACSGGSPFFNNPANGCLNAAANFTNQSTGVANTYIWKWGDASANTVVTTTTAQTHTYTAIGTYTIWLVQIFNGPPICRDSVSRTIIINSLPNPSFTFSPNNSCSLTPVQFTNTSVGAGLTYLWNFGNGTTSSLVSPSEQFDAYGNSGSTSYTVVLTATNSLGCSNTTNQNVTVQNRPNGQLVDNLGIVAFATCDGFLSYTLDVGNMSTFTTNVTNYSINWGDGSPVFSAPSLGLSHTHLYTALGYSTITLTLTSSLGCNDTTLYSFYSGTTPSVGLTSPAGTVGCLPSTFNFTPTANNSPGTAYEITTNDGSATAFYTQANIPALIPHTFALSSCGFNSPGYLNSFFFRIKAINPCGSNTSTVEPILISSKPDANFTINPGTNACVNQAVTFTNTSVSSSFVNPANYTCNAVTKINWLISPATGWVVSSGTLGNNPPSQNNPLTWGSNSLGVTFSSPGNYTISLITSGASCGNDTSIQTICITNPVVPAFTLSSLSGCAPFNCSATNTTPNPSCGNNSYSWVVTYLPTNTCDNTSAFSYTGGTTAASQNPSFSFTNSGQYTVRLNVTNACGISFATQIVTVNKPPQLSLDSIPSYCGTTNISPTAIINDCGNVISNYLWTFAGAVPASSTILSPLNILYSAANTYTVNLTASNVCGSASSSRTFTIFNPPNVIANPSTANICPGQTVNILAAGANSYAWSSAATLDVAVGSNVIASPTNTTTYIVTGTSGNCTDTAHVNVNVFAIPTLNVVPPSPNICLGDSINLSVSGASSYLWSPSINLNTNTGANIIAFPSVTSSYTVTGTSTNGCTSSTNVNITLNNLPIVNAGLDQSFCNSNSVINLVPVTFSGGIWSGQGIAANGDFNPFNAGVGLWNLVYTFTDANGCINSDTLVANVSNPSTSFAGNGFTTCANNAPINLIGGLPINGTWTGAGVSAGIFDPAIASIGQNILTYSIGGGSCLSTDTINVFVLANSAIVVSPSNLNNCLGDTLTVTASGLSNYLWSPSSGINTTVGSSIQAFPTATTIYLVSGTSANGCSSSANILITVSTPPIVLAGLDQFFCNTNSPIILSPISPLGGVWTGNGIVAATEFNPFVAGNGSWNLVYSFTDANGCENADTIVATVDALPTANAGTGFSTCQNSATISLTGALPLGGSWSGNGINLGIFDPTIVGVGISSLTYTVGSGICSSNDTIEVNIIAVPNLTVNSSANFVCAGSDITLIAAGADVYSWLPNLGVPNSFNDSITVQPSVTTTYTVTGTNQGICSTSLTIDASVFNATPIDAGPDTSFCNTTVTTNLIPIFPVGGTWLGVGVSTSGIFDPTIAGDGVWDLVYSISDINNCTYLDTLIVTVSSLVVADAGTGFSICSNSNPVVLSGVVPLSGTWTGLGVNAGNFEPSNANIGLNILTYSTGVGSCFSSDTLQVNVLNLPTLNVVANPGSICLGDSSMITVLGATNYSWIPSQITGVNSGDTVFATPTFDGYFVVVGTDLLGCSVSDSVFINVDSLPLVQAGSDETFCNQNISVQLTGNIPLGGTWSGTGISSSGLFTPTLSGIGDWDVIYSITDLNGCLNTDTLIVSVINPTLSAAGQDMAVCHFSSVFNLIGAPLGGNWSGNTYITSMGEFSPNQSGIYDAIYTTGSGTCLSIDTMQITVNVLPNINVGTDLDLCINLTSVLLTSNISGGSWNGTGIVNTATGEFNPTIIFPLTSSIVSYQYSDAITSCTNSDTLIANVHPLPIAIIDSIPLSCANTAVQFINYTIGNNVYNWSFGDGTNSTLFEPTHFFTSSDTFNIQLIATSNFGCIDSTQNQIVIAQPPSSDFSILQNSTCGQQTINFTNSSSALYSVFDWNFGNGIISNLQNPASVTYSIVGAVDTNYVVSLTINNLCGSSVHTDTVSLISLPTASFSYYPQPVCSGTSFSFSNASQGFNNSYKWFVNGSLVSTNTFFTNQTFVTGDADSIYVVELETSNICDTVSFLDSIVVHPAMVYPFFTVDSTFSCLGETVNFNSSVANYNYIFWRYGEGSNSLSNVPSHTYLTPGNYTVWQIVYGYCGLDSISRDIIVWPKPQVDFNLISPLCGFDTAVFTNLSPSLNNLYTWSFGDGSGSTQFSPNHFYQIAGNVTDTFIVKLIAVAANTLCNDSISREQIILQNPIANFNILNNEVCLGNIISAVANQQANLNYVWNISNGDNVIGPLFSYTFADTGNYSITLRVNDSFECNDDTTFNQLYIRPNAIADFSFFQDPICSTSPQLNFVNTSNLSNAYNWDFETFGTSNFNSPPPLSFITPTNFNTTLIANNNYNCPDTITKNIQIVIKPTALFSSPDSVCELQNFFLNNNSILSGTFQWSINGLAHSNGLNTNYTATESNQIDVLLMAISDFDQSCFDTISKIIKVNKLPSAIFTSTPIDSIIEGKEFTPCGGLYVFNPTYDNTDVLYEWSLGENIRSTAINPKAFFETNGDFLIELKVTNIFGCINERDTTLEVFCDGNIALPNAMAPDNADSQLAWFIPKGKNIDKLSIEIFSTWGERVWFTNALNSEGSPTEYWDGTYNSKAMPQGAFLVKVKANFKNKAPFEKSYYLSLIR